MATETFKWRVERNLSPTIGYRVIETQFGDGYVQTSADGINTKDESYQIRVVLKSEAEATEVMDFFDRHAGYKTFLWKPPLGKMSLFRCSDPTPSPQGGNVFVITGTFVKSYSNP